MKSLFIVLCLCMGFMGTAQVFNYNGSIEATGAFSNEDRLPFWFYTNTNTALNPETNISGTAGFQATYSFENSILEAGIAGFYRDGDPDELQRRDMFISYRNNWLKATLGARKQELSRNGLSASGNNFLWSQNARPLPGLLVEASQPLRLTQTFALDWGIAHYQLNDDRYVENTRVHYKRLGLITTFNKDHQMTIGIQHVAQWGGTSPVYGEFPEGFDTFLDVFTARRRDITLNGSTFENAVGNHLGTYLFEYGWNTTIGQWVFYHEHPFEDGSGARWNNLPDGVWGLSYEPANTKWIKAVLYEHTTTTNQSKGRGESAIDNYFANNLYRSGWSYEQTTIGFPFIIYDENIPVTENTSPLANNRVNVHHLGVSGAFKNWEWMLRSSYASQLGNFRAPIEPAIKNWHNALSLSYATNQYGTFTALGAVDASNTFPTVVGGGLSYRYTFSSNEP